MINIMPLAQFQDVASQVDYAVILQGRIGNARNGCRCCDFQDATVSFIAPRQPESMFHRGNDADGQALTFSRELEQCPEFRAMLDGFTFFRYKYSESLHLSCREREVLQHCLDDLRKEAAWGLDGHSCRLVMLKTEQLLTYCRRFYDRQFITRSEACRCLSRKLESVADTFITTHHTHTASPLAAGMMAAEMQMSQAYLLDFILHDTGLTLKEYMQLRLFTIAKSHLAGTTMTVGAIAQLLGFPSATYFCDIFKRVNGCTPTEYRHGKTAASR